MDLNLVLQNIILGLAIVTGLKYILYLIASRFYDENKKKYLLASINISKEQLEKRIKVSVIVPAWNEEIGILTSVKSLLASSYNNLEIIVVNDGSTDGTDHAINDFIKKSLSKLLTQGHNFKYFAKTNGGEGKCY